VSPDGTRLAVAHKRWTLTLRDVTNSTDKVVFEVLDSPMRSASFSPDGSKFALVVDMSIYIWDTITGHLLGKSQKHGVAIRDLALSPDGTRIISISSEDTAQTWQIGEDLGIIFDTCGDPPISAVFFPDGARFITISKSGTIRVWDITSTTSLSVVHKLPLLSFSWTDGLAISSDGTRLISKRYLWDIINCQVLKSFYAFAAKFSPDGTRAAIALRTGVQILDANSGAVLYQQYVFGFGDMSFSLDSTRLFCWTFDGIVCITDLTCLPTSVNTEVLSCVYPPDSIMIQSSQYNGWYRATNGDRLIWLPQDMQPVWLATGSEPSGSRRLILGSTNDLAILDMEDYLEVPPVAAAWRKGGTRYMIDTASQASALMSESGSAVWFLCFCYLYSSLILSCYHDQNILFTLPYIAPEIIDD
jgi:WD40 repeat protein